MLFHDPVAEGQAQPQPLFFGGEERIEDVAPHRLGNSLAFVGDQHLNHAPRPRSQVHLGKERVHAEPRGESQAAASRHRFDRVPHQIVKDLEETILVGQDRRQARVVALHDRHALPASHFFREERHPLEKLVEVQWAEAKLNRAAEVQKHLDDPVDPVDFFGENRRVLNPSGFVPQLPPEELDRAADGAQRIADLVGQPHRHPSHGGQRLPTPHVIFELAEPGHVSEHRHRGLHPT